MLLLAIKISFQNFSIKHFQLPLPSQKITLEGSFVERVHYKIVFEPMPV